MLKRTVCIVGVISSLLLSGLIAQEAGQKQKISGPFTHKNLSVFLIHGKNTLKIKKLLTLKEAIEQKKIVIYETEEVNELQVENISNSHIFIQEGDIVKGGKQDRVLQYDFVVAPKSGKIPITSFCVEQSRWSKRGNEDLAEFGSSNNRIASKQMKLATKQNQSQAEVWNEVAVVQEKLSKSTGVTVNSPASESSLQLALENKTITKSTNEYIDKINKEIKNEQDVIGYVFAINGEINSADIYGSSELFKKMWPKLLEASAIEAISELNRSAKFNEVTTGQVGGWLNEAETGKESKVSLNNKMEIKKKDSDKNVLFDSYSEDNKDQWIHRNMIKK